MAIFVMSIGKIFLAAAGLFSTANAAATLFTNGTIIAFENASNSLNIIRNGSVLVENDRITAVVPASYTGALPSDTEIINLAGDILSPGMVDTHRHTWQYVYKNLGTNMTFIDYLLRLGPTSRASDIFTPEDVYASEKMGLYEALHGGTTTVVSHSQVQWTEAHSDASIQASVDSGSRVFWSFAFTLSSALGQAVLTFEEHVALLRRQFERNIHRGTAVSIGFTYDTFNSAENTEETNAVVQLAT
jgi:cytosine/adenosine deaminase-related metal-dependent hydrolase